MKITCPECQGSGDIYDAELDKYLSCPTCCGKGDAEACLSEITVSTLWNNADEIAELKKDALKAKADHQRISEINPRAKESYDRQLAATLDELNRRADALLK